MGESNSFLRWIAARLCNITLFVYVDDCFAAEPVSKILSAFKSTRELFALFGPDIEEDKGKKPTTNLTLLGAQIRFPPGWIMETFPMNTRPKYASELRAILARNTLGPAEAAKMRGKLGYAQTLLFGRDGRSPLHPFSDRQYETTSSSSTSLSKDLDDVIPFWLAQLGGANPRAVCTRPMRPALVYKDAFGEGNLVAITVLDGAVSPHHTHAPPRFVRGKTGISELELLACALGILADMDITPDRPMLLCCDNLGARGAVMRGSCCAVVGRMLSAAFWNLAAPFGCAAWVEFVPSSLNCAGPPSRTCPLLPSDTRAEEVSEGVPALFATLLQPRPALAAAQYKTPEGGTNKAIGWPCPEHNESRDPSEQ